MTSLINMLNEYFPIIGLFISFGVFEYLMKQIENADPESGLHIYSRTDGAIFLLQMLVSNILVMVRFTDLIDRIFYMLMFGIMIVHAYTDKKTKTVYRPFNYLMWMVGIFYTVLKIFVLKSYPFMDGGPTYTLVYLGIFLALMYFFTFILHISGKGDGFMLIGLSFFITFATNDTYMLTLFTLLLYYVFAGLYQIFANLDKIERKPHLRFKEKLPFAPALLYGAWILLIATYIFTLPQFQLWQIEHLPM